jgi:hypothetical protein
MNVLVALSVALPGLAGCYNRGPETPCCEPFTLCDHCVADPVPHCVATTELCESGDDCASGLSCAEIPLKTACITSEDMGRRCRPAPFEPLALQQGFGVAGMTIYIDPGASPPVVSWASPPGTRHVACALFTCNPAFQLIGATPDDTDQLFKIVNFEQCVLLFGARSATQSFALSDANAYTGIASCAPTEDRPRIVNELAAACWAYGETSILAASELVHVRGSNLPELSRVPHDSSCSADGTACYDATADLFGVCQGGECRSRCRSAADCTLRAGGGTGDDCAWSCSSVLGETLGACVPAI